MQDFTEQEVDCLVAYRHELHAHPELSLEEEWTAASVVDCLNELGVETHSGVGGNGVVGVIRGEGEGGSVALRADMDALAIQEEGTHARRPRRSP